jgi:hypothetical protein
MSKLFIATILAVLVGSALVLIPTHAATPGTAKDAVALAASHPTFVAALKAHPGWKGEAYFTDNGFDVWRVQFWDKDGKEIGFADVNVTRKRVYWVEVHYKLMPDLKQAAAEHLRKFVRTNADVKAVIGNPDDYDFTDYDYDSGGNFWVVIFARKSSAVAVVVQFQSNSPTVFDRPVLKGFFFPNVLPYADWEKAQKAEAQTIAFSQPEITAAVRGQSGWTATATRTGDTTWTVTFMHGDTKLAEADVDTQTRKILAFRIFVTS